MAEIENRGPELFNVAMTLMVIAVVICILRVYTRLCVVKVFGLDDWFMCAATVSFILFDACAITGIHYGTGRHRDDLEPADFSQAMKYWWYCYIWYCLTMITSKISIGVFLLRLTPVRIHHWIIYTVMFLSVITGAVFFFVTLLQCRPISYFWNQNQKGSCIPTDVIIALTYLYSVFSVICDFTFAILPMFLIRGLQMDSRTKWALVPILCLACVASIAVAVRFAYIHKFKDPDFLWATLDIAIWSCSEQGLAVIAGCLATLRPLVRFVGESCGLWSTPTVVRRSAADDLGSGHLERSKRQRTGDQSLHSFGMNTFIQADDDDRRDVDGDLKYNNNIFATTTITMSNSPDIGNAKSGHDNKQKNFWGDSRQHANESEEELNDQSSKESSSNGKRAKPKSFLGKEKSNGSQ